MDPDRGGGELHASRWGLVLAQRPRLSPTDGRFGCKVVAGESQSMSFMALGMEKDATATQLRMHLQ